MIFQNELLFVFHLAFLLSATIAALRFGPLALTLLICVEAILANLFVFKEIHLFGLVATPTDVFAVASLYGLNLLREFHGPNASKIASNLSIGALLFFAFMALIQLWYKPSEGDIAHAAFKTILSPSPRIFLASLSVYAIVQQIDLRLFSSMKKSFPLFARISLSLILSETIDTILFSFLGLYGLISSISSVILVSLAIKWIAIALGSPFVFLAKRTLRST